MEARYMEIIECIDDDMAKLEVRLRGADSSARLTACLNHAFDLGEVTRRASPELSNVVLGRVVRNIVAKLGSLCSTGIFPRGSLEL
jgi:hypothetical protein